ncbi:MAG: VOC family protein [Pseudomonadota bacterium]
MTVVQRFFFNLTCENLERSVAFYTRLLSLKVHFESDWFVILKPNGDSLFELGLIDKTHDVVPPGMADRHAGFYPTFVVDDIEPVHSAACEIGAHIVEAPRLMFYGQTRMLVRDPDGVVVDISAITR